MKTEESLFLRSFLLRKKENSLFEGNLYERNKRFLISSEKFWDVEKPMGSENAETVGIVNLVHLNQEKK